jgi:hypothetical protein
VQPVRQQATRAFRTRLTRLPMTWSTSPDGVVNRMRYEVGYSAVGPSAEAMEVGGRYGDDFGGFQFRY